MGDIRASACVTRPAAVKALITVWTGKRHVAVSKVAKRCALLINPLIRTPDKVLIQRPGGGVHMLEAGPGLRLRRTCCEKRKEDYSKRKPDTDHQSTAA